MATTTNYAWETPDDTDLVKDGAAAIRTLGSSIDTTTKALNPSTTLGDIEYRSSTANTNTRLGIGTTGQVLTVSGGVPTWASAAAATPSFSLITSGALSGSSTSYTGLSGKNSFLVIIDNLSTDSTAGNNITVTFNSDTASNYAYSGLLLSYSGTTLSTSGRRSAGTTSIPMGRTTNDIGNILCASFTIEGANSTGIKTGQINTGTYNNTDLAQSNILGYRYSGTSVISSIQVSTGAGSFDAGTVYIYGSVA